MKRKIAVAAASMMMLAGCGTAAGTPAGSSAPSGDAKPHVAMLLAGSSTDKGFMQSGFTGLKRAESELGVSVSVKEGVAPTTEALAAGLRELAASDPDMIIAHGGQNSDAAVQVAKEFPDIAFVVTQANVKGANLSSYEVLQEHSAWLAGAAAGLLTKSNVVGHMSGIRPVPGLKGRAAYVDGVAHTNPKAKVLSNFSGDQDDVELSRKIATAEIKAGADYIFTMLNAGRPGVAEAMKASGKARQFGNVRDFTKDDPAIFAGSAVADSGAAAFQAVKDLVDGKFSPGSTKHIGLENPEAVRLTLAADVPKDVREKIDGLAKKIIDGSITVKTEYSGPEFTVK
ncbi:BMP family ABC transporter substrate-binding protein [Arthrobacter sp. SW1]|uniref:BMP family protein n=1 Tax=Arthrobacter sp. SW1 TaxID=1920889 RepID=UPI000877B0FE|nr:BMP family protein [Arthrobacter sp. SW1]OFI37399.1 BMP family ABC transporter substrate-binding protein [Arthrobacter sp. SW1]